MQKRNSRSTTLKPSKIIVQNRFWSNDKMWGLESGFSNWLFVLITFEKEIRKYSALIMIEDADKFLKNNKKKFDSITKLIQYNKTWEDYIMMALNYNKGNIVEDML